MTDDRQRDNDPQETREWVEAIESVIAFEGTERADSLLTSIVDVARRNGANLPFAANTAYINTIHPDEQPPYAGRPRSRAQGSCGDPLECGGDRAQGEQGKL